MNALKMCLNPKVLAGLAVVAVGLFVFAPDVALGALPVLVALACPLSMVAMALFMGKGMQGTGTAQGAATGRYSCPMHPEVMAAVPGPCPRCGMALQAVAAPQMLPVGGTGQGGTGTGKEERLVQLRAQLQQVQDQQTAIARELEQLQDGEPESESRAVREAEQVVRKTEPKT